MKKLTLFIGLCSIVHSLSACDVLNNKLVSIERGATIQTKGKTDCNYAGYCYKAVAIGPGSRSGFQFSTFCNGHQDALLEETPAVYHFGDGESRHITETKVLETYGSCS